MYLWLGYRCIDVDSSPVVRRLGLGEKENGDEDPCYDRIARYVACNVCCDGTGTDCRHYNFWSLVCRFLLA